MKILHFGAGNIGRGLVFPFFRENHEIILTDSNVELIENIKKNHGYRLIELDYGKEFITKITDPPIITTAEATKISDVDVITTSVCVPNLIQVSPILGEIIKKIRDPLYIIPLENALEAVDVLKAALEKYIQKRNKIYFLKSVIDRIVPGVKKGIDIECEKFCSIKIENRYHFSDFLRMGNVLVDDIEKELDKKFLFVNGLHACAAYLGYLRGHEYIRDVMQDNLVRQKLDKIAECYLRYLVGVYKYQEDELIPYLKSVFVRFSNPSLLDPLSRVGRNLLVKLAPNDRIYRPLVYNRNHGFDYKPLEEVVHAAKHFTIANDYDRYLSYIAGKNSTNI